MHPGHPQFTLNTRRLFVFVRRVLSCPALPCLVLPCQDRNGPFGSTEAPERPTKELREGSLRRDHTRRQQRRRQGNATLQKYIHNEYDIAGLQAAWCKFTYILQKLWYRVGQGVAVLTANGNLADKAIDHGSNDNNRFVIPSFTPVYRLRLRVWDYSWPEPHDLFWPG